MNKITKAITATTVGIALALGGSVTANAADALDLGNPYLSHGDVYHSHVRGGDWGIASKAYADSFSTYQAPLTLREALPEGKTIERLRLVFTPDADVTAEALAAEVAAEASDLAPGSTWFKGFVVGHSQVLNGKVVVHVFRVVNG